MARFYRIENESLVKSPKSWVYFDSRYSVYYFIDCNCFLNKLKPSEPFPSTLENESLVAIPVNSPEELSMLHKKIGHSERKRFHRTAKTNGKKDYCITRNLEYL